MSSRTASLRNLLEAVPGALVGVDRAGVIQYVNRQAESLFGYEGDGLVGQPIETLVPDSVRAGHPAHRAAYFAGPGTRRPKPDKAGTTDQKPGPPPRCLRGRRRDGTEFPLNLSLSRIDTEDGLLVIAAVRDLTEREKANDRRDQLSRLAAIVENSDEAIIGKTLDGTITNWNPAAERLYGYSSEEIVGRPAALLVPRERPDEMSAILARIRAGQHIDHFETTRVRKDGTVFAVSISVSPIRDPDGVIIGASSIGRDVTMERESFEAARSMIESSLDSLVTISPEGRITDANEATVKVTGVPREELIGTAFSDYFTEPEKANAIYQLVFTEGMAVDYPLTIRHRDGTLTDVRYNASVQRSSADTVLGVFAAARDMTRLVQAFGAARSMIEASLDSLVSISPEGRITDANEATVKLTGVPREELIGTAFSDYFTEPEKANAIYHLVLAHGTAVDYPLTMRHRDGTLTEVLYNASAYRDAGGEVLGVFAAARDVTKQRKAGAQYARSLIEAALDPLVTISPEGKIDDVNESTVKVTGVPREELIGTDFSSYFTEPGKALAGYQQAFAEGSVTDYPLTLRHRDGSLIDVLYNVSVYRDPDGNVLGVFAAARDVTEQKRTQAELARQAVDLERLAELERFHRLTVGRELRMIELKKEIDGLKELVEQNQRERRDQL
ncbi:MAG TPA: PAS domain S-box protein [Dermatophilaceae bacterium]|jgi:PAS domain S-box-containing protein